MQKRKLQKAVLWLNWSKIQTKLKEHLSDIRKEDQSKPVGAQFYLPGHNMWDLEKCRDDSRTNRMIRESWFINKLKSKICDINRKM